MSPSNDTARVALTQWTRSASQNNVDALVKVGDYYYHGFGVPDEPEAVRWEKAAGYYQSAADTQFSALAMWNLGWMYENGVGVTQVRRLNSKYISYSLMIYSRTSTWQRGITTSRWRPTLRRTSQSRSRSSSCASESSGILQSCGIINMVCYRNARRILH